MNLVNFTTKYKFTILLTLIALLVFCLGIFVIKKYIYPRTSNMEGYSNDDSELKLIMFHVNWCPHCKTAKPVWDKITQNYNNVTVNNTKLQVISLDCTDENSTSSDFNNNTVEEILSRFTLNGNPFAVEGYPTIVMANKSNAIIGEFNKATTYKNVEDFINDHLS